MAVVKKIMIIEDHPLFSKGLCSLINSREDYNVVGEAKDSKEALKLAAEGEPDLAILDLNLGNEDGLDLLKEMRRRFPKIAVLVLSMHDERYYAERVLKAGGRGYIMKTEAGNKVIEASETVLAGKIYFSEAQRERLAGYLETGGERPVPVETLSDRQFQVFNLLGKGLGTVEIAAKLKLSAKTIDTHKEHIKDKLRCNTAQELKQLAIEWVNRSAG
ncbi:MAG: response regulator transcription factor [Spirochaetaceae bacterium]|jgi:DNA-binding NarL/FixJ family response regulator|nr:response regulator transcription factor [Spirochaetaceae bacterium]